MGKRPYYIIYWTRDCDGYEFFQEYIGSNYKAALSRYERLFFYIKDREFLQENIREDRINASFNLPAQELRPGQNICSYLNDDDCCWITITLQCVNTDKFSTGAFEDRYRIDVPNSKH